MAINGDAAYLEQSQLVISEPLWRHIKQGTGTFVVVTSSWLAGS